MSISIPAYDVNTDLEPNFDIVYGGGFGSGPIQAGDLMVIFVAFLADIQAGIMNYPQPIDGTWSMIGSRPGSGTTIPAGTVWTKTATAADVAAGKTTLQFPQSPYQPGQAQGFSSALMFAYRSSSLGNVCLVDQIATSANQLGGAFPWTFTPNVTTSNTDFISSVIALAAITAGSNTFPSGYTLNQLTQNGESGDAVFAPTFQAASQAAVPPGSTGLLDWVTPASFAAGAFGVTLAIKEVSGVSKAPSPLFPVNVQLDASVPIPYEWKYNAANGQPMSGYQLRVKAIGGATYFYYNASANTWTTTPVTNALVAVPGANVTVSPPAGVTNEPTNGGTGWTWSAATVDIATSTLGPFTADAPFQGVAPPTGSITAPTGVQTVSQPTIVFVGTPTSGQQLIGGRLIIYNAAQYGIGGFTPGVSPSFADTGLVLGLTSPTIPPNPLPPDSYRIYYFAAQTGPQYSTGTFVAFSVAVDTPNTPSVSWVFGNDPTLGYPTVAATLIELDNLMLTADASSFEGSNGGWVAFTNATFANSTVRALDGTHSLLMKATASGNAAITSAIGTAGIPVVPATQYSAVVNCSPATTARSFQAIINWYNSAGTFLSASTGSSTAEAASPNWTQATVTATSPAGAAFAAIECIVLSPAANEQHYVDRVGLFHGSSFTWTLGGYVGNSYWQVQSSVDNVNWSDIRVSGRPTTAGEPAVTLIDAEPTPGVTTFYRARVVFNSGVSLYASPWTATASGITSTNGKWFILDPTNPSTAAVFDLAQDGQRIIHEVATVMYPIGRATGIKSTDGFKGRGFTIRAQTTTAAQLAALEGLIMSTVNLLVQWPMSQEYVMHDPGTDHTENLTYGTLGKPTPWIGTDIVFLSATKP